MVSNYTALRGGEKTDVAVVGGGLSGLTIALWLARAGFRITVLEAENFGWGASGKCSGIVSATYEICSRLEKEKGKLAAESYVRTQESALKNFLELSRQLNIDVTPMAVHGLKRPPSLGRNINAYYIDSSVYLSSLLKWLETFEVRLYEHSRVTNIQNHAVYTEGGSSVRAPYIVVATGYPIINSTGWYFMRLEQRWIYKALVPVRFLDNAVFYSSTGKCLCCTSERFAFVQVEGESVGTGKNIIIESIPEHIQNALKHDSNGLRRRGIECYTPDELPYIGIYSRRIPNIFIATGYGGRGILGSITAAQAICGRILGLPMEGYDIFDAQRKISSHKVPLKTTGRYLKGLAGGWGAPRCSHMGCKLVYNQKNRLWECPCHGSRFDDIGRVVSAPAVRPAQLRERK